MKNLMLLMILALSVHAVAETTASVNGNTPPSSGVRGQQHFPPSVQSLFACADRTPSTYYGQNLISWRGTRRGFTGPREVSVAMSAFLPKGLDGEQGPGVLTVTKGKIYYNAVTVTKMNSGYFESPEAHVTLNLKNQVDKEHGLPLVVEEDSISKSWFTRISVMRSGYYETKAFRDLKADHSEINASSELYGDQAKFAIAKWSELLESRLTVMPNMVTRMHSTRPSGSFAPEFSIPSGELDYIREGLCSCASAFPDKVQEIRKQFAGDDFPIQVHGDDRRSRKITYSDLDCGMS